MLDAAKRLRLFLDGPPKVTQTEFARRIGASQVSVSAWIAGNKLPLRFAFAIEDETGIRAADWQRPRARKGRAA